MITDGSSSAVITDGRPPARRERGARRRRPLLQRELREVAPVDGAAGPSVRRHRRRRRPILGGSLLLRSRAAWSLDLPVNALAVTVALSVLIFYAIGVGLKAHHTIIWGAVLLAGALPVWNGADPGNIGLVIIGAAHMVCGVFDHRLFVHTFGSPKNPGLTKGNLSSHLTKLEAAGLVEIRKRFVHKKPNTNAALTSTGKQRIARHWDQLERLKHLGHPAAALPDAAPRRPASTRDASDATYRAQPARSRSPEPRRTWLGSMPISPDPGPGRTPRTPPRPPARPRTPRPGRTGTPRSTRLRGRGTPRGRPG